MSTRRSRQESNAESSISHMHNARLTLGDSEWVSYIQCGLVTSFEQATEGLNCEMLVLFHCNQLSDIRRVVIYANPLMHVERRDRICESLFDRAFEL